MRTFILYITTLITFLIIDLLWLGLFAKNLYQTELGFIMAKSPNWPPAILFYLLYVGGLLYFVITPAIHAHDWTLALKNGVIFGLITYATYDLTNYATLENWPLKITLIDLIWGSFLCGSVSTITFWLTHFFNKS